MNKTSQQILLGLAAFLAAWQSSNFGLEFHQIMGAVTAAVAGFVAPKVS